MEQQTFINIPLLKYEEALLCSLRHQLNLQENPRSSRHQLTQQEKNAFYKWRWFQLFARTIAGAFEDDLESEYKGDLLAAYKSVLREPLWRSDGQSAGKIRAHLFEACNEDFASALSAGKFFNVDELRIRPRHEDLNGWEVLGELYELARYRPSWIRGMHIADVNEDSESFGQFEIWKLIHVWAVHRIEPNNSENIHTLLLSSPLFTDRYDVKFLDHTDHISVESCPRASITRKKKVKVGWKPFLKTMLSKHSSRLNGTTRYPHTRTMERSQ